MLVILAVSLVLMWGLALLTSFTMGGLIHLLLVGAVMALSVRAIQARRFIP